MVAPIRPTLPASAIRPVKAEVVAWADNPSETPSTSSSVKKVGSFIYYPADVVPRLQNQVEKQFAKLMLVQDKSSFLR
jgi:hypothetical protein